MNDGTDALAFLIVLVILAFIAAFVIGFAFHLGWNLIG